MIVTMSGSAQQTTTDRVAAGDNSTALSETNMAATHPSPQSSIETSASGIPTEPSRLCTTVVVSHSIAAEDKPRSV